MSTLSNWPLRLMCLLLTTRCWKAQIAQQATSSSTPPSRLPKKPKSNPHEHCNCVTLKEGVEDPKDTPLKEGVEVIMAESKERSDSGKPITLIEDDSFEIPTVFPPKVPNPCSFTIPCVVGK